MKTNNQTTTTEENIVREEKRAQIKELAIRMTPEKRELLIALLGATVECRS